MHRGNILLHRKMVDWEWYCDANVMRLFVHLILTANWEPKKWKGVQINRGQKITSVGNLAQELNLSAKQIRVALSKLKRAGEVASKGTSKFTVVTLTNYDLYQDAEKIRASKRANNGANKGQAKGKQRATTKSLESLESLNNKKDMPDELRLPDALSSPEFADAWSLWLKYRKEIKKPLKDTTMAIQLKKFETEGVARSIEAINNSIENGWQGLVWDKVKAEKPDEYEIDEHARWMEDDFQRAVERGEA